jgi:hypothetical protein
MFYPLLRRDLLRSRPRDRARPRNDWCRLPQGDRHRLSAGQRRAAGSGTGDGARPSPTRWAWRPASTRTASTSTPWPRWVSASSKSAPSPRARSRATPSRGCSAFRSGRRSSIAWVSTTTASTSCWPTCRRRQVCPQRRHSRHQHRQELRYADRAAADDYLICLERVYAAASYVAINISSPNTKNLRELQQDDALDALLGCLKAAQERLADRHGKYVPLALKIAPDLDDAQIQAIADLLRAAPHGWGHRHQHHARAQRGRRPAERRRRRRAFRRAGARTLDGRGEQAVGGARRRSADHRRRRHHERGRCGAPRSRPVPAWSSSTPASSIVVRN